MKTKSSPTTMILVGAAVIAALFFMGKGGTPAQTIAAPAVTNNYITQTSPENGAPQTRYYCCSVVGTKGCYLNTCPAGGSQVFTGFFNELAQCGAQCTNAQQPAQQPAQPPAQPPAPTDDCVSDCSELGMSGGTVLLDDQWGNSDCPVWQQQIQLVDQFTEKCCCIKAPFCTDSDAQNGASGDNPWLKGTCTDNGGTHTDDCYTQVRLTEWVCEGTACMRHTQTATNNCNSVPISGLCLDGACIT